MTANIIHTMKHTVNAIVLMATTDHCFVLCDATMDPFTKVKNRPRVTFYYGFRVFPKSRQTTVGAPSAAGRG
jgi:hypothetical protein